jgi:hypothetical protein
MLIMPQVSNSAENYLPGVTKLSQTQLVDAPVHSGGGFFHRFLSSALSFKRNYFFNPLRSQFYRHPKTDIRESILPLNKRSRELSAFCLSVSPQPWYTAPREGE